MSHTGFMYRCLELAKRGAGYVAPNPMVGCVIVHDGRIIGEGWHKNYGGPHAEPEAITSVKNKALLAESTLYVSLEPCAHHGKTPPCADLIVRTGIPKVVIGCSDPFKEVNGRGISILKTAGIAVTSGVLENECAQLNRRFFTFHRQNRPYILLKWACSADGFLAPPGKQRTQISSEPARILLHKWRSEEAAVLVGSETLKTDRPLLDTRFWNGRNPARIFACGHLKNLPEVDDAPSLIFNFEKDGIYGAHTLIKTNENEPVWSALQALHKRNIQSVLVEGGRNTLQQFLDAGIWDELRIIRSNTVFMKEGIAAPALSVMPDETETVGTDTIQVFYSKTAQ
ncbi:MAG: bifunctional diaminohydroxyphosphoribosylaminopyrimidine deaminase/5-amino-6-(5-phosphoribosylamino)uracil reductase RibD [Bacteroidetes bacterium]|nr:bifunctional diaminohydroxyphosphoribosylaminopyrimidine deaminase/5-amino-6-(5-phosphoribosylamino)uracil reductase RibD [Bacteroidota bacterium]